MINIVYDFIFAICHSVRKFKKIVKTVKDSSSFFKTIFVVYFVKCCKNDLFQGTNCGELVAKAVRISDHFPITDLQPGQKPSDSVLYRLSY